MYTTPLAYIFKINININIGLSLRKQNTHFKFSVLNRCLLLQLVNAILLTIYVECMYVSSLSDLLIYLWRDVATPRGKRAGVPINHRNPTIFWNNFKSDKKLLEQLQVVKSIKHFTKGITKITSWILSWHFLINVPNKYEGMWHFSLRS